jgi:hypothetical protein
MFMCDDGEERNNSLHRLRQGRGKMVGNWEDGRWILKLPHPHANGLSFLIRAETISALIAIPWGVLFKPDRSSSVHLLTLIHSRDFARALHNITIRTWLTVQLWGSVILALAAGGLLVEASPNPNARNGTTQDAATSAHESPRTSSYRLAIAGCAYSLLPTALPSCTAGSAPACPALPCPALPCLSVLRSLRPCY